MKKGRIKFAGAIRLICLLGLIRLTTFASSYVVQKNDTLSAIATRYGMSTETLAGLNQLKPPYVIRVGDRLTVPKNGMVSYLVKEGDSLSRVASRLNTTVETLARVNALKKPYTIRVNQSLKVPLPSPGVRVIETPEPSLHRSVTEQRIAMSVPESRNPPPSSASRMYRVKAGDCLSDIAEEHEISLDSLIEKNGLRNPHRIQPGMRLNIPTETYTVGPRAPRRPALPARAKPKAPPLDSTVKHNLDRTKIRSKTWKYIVIHHSGARKGVVKYMDEYHRRERGMENGLAYHFVIGNGNGMRDGEIAIGPRWTKQINGGHLASDKLNQISLGICLVGDFRYQAPTAKQTQALLALSHYLLERCKLDASAVRTHRHINTRPTVCPGDKFPIRSVQSKLKSYQ